MNGMGQDKMGHDTRYETIRMGWFGTGLDWIGRDEMERDNMGHDAGSLRDGTR